MTATIYIGDSRERLRELEAGSVHAVVTDPPYELGFMGKTWDSSGIAYDVELWREVLRVLKPGGHLLAFGGTRTYHRMACAIEDAGFEIRDQLQWLYGSGFPKSLDVSKAIDRKRDDLEDTYRVTAWVRAARDAAGLGNRDIDEAFGANGMGRHWTDIPPHGRQPTVPTLEQIPKLLEVLGDPDVPDEVRELIWTLNGRKGQPGEAWLERESTRVAGDRGGFAGERLGTEGNAARDIPASPAAKDWDGWGTALKPANEPIVLARKPFPGTVAANVLEHGCGGLNVGACRVVTDGGTRKASLPKGPSVSAYGNGLNGNCGVEPTGEGRWPSNVLLGCACEGEGHAEECAVAVLDGQTDEIGASRFFYVAKPSAAERHIGGTNTHATVKPVELMAYLVRMITPPGGTVLDPFFGSGTTAIACARLGFDCIGVELDPKHVEICERRIREDQPLFAQIEVKQ